MEVSVPACLLRVCHKCKQGEDPGRKMRRVGGTATYGKRGQVCTTSVRGAIPLPKRYLRRQPVLHLQESADKDKRR